MSVSNPLVTPIHNGTIGVNVVFFFCKNRCMCVLKDIDECEPFLDKNLTSFIR